MFLLFSPAHWERRKSKWDSTLRNWGVFKELNLTARAKDIGSKISAKDVALVELGPKSSCGPIGSSGSLKFRRRRGSLREGVRGSLLVRKRSEMLEMG